MTLRNENRELTVCHFPGHAMMADMKRTPNPHGKHGNPISLADYSFEDVVRKALNTPAPSKHPQKTVKKPAKKR